MDRRSFVKVCAGTVIAAACSEGRQARAEPITAHAPARLLRADGSPLKAAGVPPDEALVFAYPYRGVPCFLIRLGTSAHPPATLVSPDDGSYACPPAVGPGARLVAFVAICPHQLSYPTPEVSVIRYASAASPVAAAPGRIVCCAHGSVYDPAAGAVRVSGPAPGPLLPVRLDYDADTDGITATGAVGDKFLARFFAAYKSELIDRFGPGGYRVPVGPTSTATPLDQYSAHVSSC